MVKSDDPNDPFEYNINGTTVSVMDIFKIDNLDIVIPEKVTINNIQYTVTSIDNNAFEERNIKSIKIPATITHIGNTFNNCYKLKRVEFLGEKPNIEPDAFTSIGTQFSPTFGYVNNKLESWKGTNYINELVIKNNIYYIKFIISIIIGLVLLYIITITDTSIWFKIPLYILIVLLIKFYFRFFLLDYSIIKLLISELVVPLIFTILAYIVIRLPIKSNLKNIYYIPSIIIPFLFILFLFVISRN